MFEQTALVVPQLVHWRDRIHGPFPKPDNLYFTGPPNGWPSAHKWASGKYLKIKKTVVVDFARSYTIPESDYKEIDLSNAAAGIKLYPESEGNVHEILVGFKPGNYVTQIDIPSGKYLATLPESSMIPSKTDATLKYLNAKNPEDSPPDNPVLKFWAIKDMPVILLRLLTLSGVDYERCTMVFKIAKHVTEEIPLAPGQMPPVATPIFWHEELSWT